MINEIKDCAFQYAYMPFPYLRGEVEIVEDISEITYKQASDLWEKYKPDFINKLKENKSPEMVIWVDMKDEFDYHSKKCYANHEIETDGQDLFKTVKQFINP